MKFYQELVDDLSELTNLKTLILAETRISKELEFSKFEKLNKLLTSLEFLNNNTSKFKLSSYLHYLHSRQHIYIKEF